MEIVTRHTGATICVVDKDLHVLYVNEAYANWFKVRPADLIGRFLPSLYSEAARVQFQPHIDKAMSGQQVTYQRQICGADGQEMWFSISLNPWYTPEGQVGGVVNSALEVHELKVTTNALRAANQRLFSHMENSPLAVVELDAKLGLVHCSSRATEWFGWHHASHQGESVLNLVGEGARVEPLRKALQRLLTGSDRQNRVEASLARPDGSVQHCMWFNSALINLRGETVSIMCQIEDISERVAAADRLMHLAQHDSLTGLLNRGAFMVQAEEAVENPAQASGGIVILFMDLDGFKDVNDHHGHHMGDTVLRLVAQRLASVVRADDTLARLGGDEFTVLMRGNPGPQGLVRYIDSIMETFAAPFVLPSGVPVTLGVSIGVASHPPLPAQVDELLTRADHAMYEAKRGGKGTVHYALPALPV
ncbi:diguanylate cyclase [Acidovorax sp. DW039]|uniref:diguanylate cyclase n=1 Tax=Acidovorax sp. DW039 TaxID=3095606 RepID=UPI0030D4D874